MSEVVTEENQMLANWPISFVRLRVKDIGEVVKFYKALGFILRAKTSSIAVLGTQNTNFLILESVPKAEVPRIPSVGLYHIAIRLPSRKDLARFLINMANAGIGMSGAADHLVSEAIYLSDPEDNGLEFYSDKPSEQWVWRDGTVQMDTLQLDFEGLLREVKGPVDSFELPDASVIGHLHLVVKDLDVSEGFYMSLGFSRTANWGRFRFLSLYGYHHHIAINNLGFHYADKITPEITGIASFGVKLPIPKNEIIEDPIGIKVYVNAADDAST